MGGVDPRLLDPWHGLDPFTRQRSIAAWQRSQRLPAGVLRTYQIAAPRDTHTRPATCVEVGCVQQRDGWRTVLDEHTAEGAKMAADLRAVCRPVGARLSPAVAARVRRYTESRDPAGLSVFDFPAGQTCFRPHRVPVGRPELFVVREGTVVSNPRREAPRVHDRPEHWVEDFAENQDRLATAQQRG